MVDHPRTINLIVLTCLPMPRRSQPVSSPRAYLPCSFPSPRKTRHSHLTKQPSMIFSVSSISKLKSARDGPVTSRLPARGERSAKVLLRPPHRSAILPTDACTVLASVPCACNTETKMVGRPRTGEGTVNRYPRRQTSKANALDLEDPLGRRDRCVDGSPSSWLARPTPSRSGITRHLQSPVRSLRHDRMRTTTHQPCYCETRIRSCTETTHGGLQCEVASPAGPSGARPARCCWSSQPGRNRRGTLKARKR